MCHLPPLPCQPVAWWLVFRQSSVWHNQWRHHHLAPYVQLVKNIRTSSDGYVKKLGILGKTVQTTTSHERLLRRISTQPEHVCGLGGGIFQQSTLVFTGKLRNFGEILIWKNSKFLRSRLRRSRCLPDTFCGESRQKRFLRELVRWRSFNFWVS